MRVLGLTEMFDRRSGRVIGAGRLALACVFLIAVALDSRQPAAPAVAFSILGLYLIVASALLVGGWNRWWIERRFGLAAHILDIAVFTAMIALTDGYSSPFFTFFVFLLLSAAIRWGWFETALTALGVVPLFLLAGAASLLWAGGDFDLRRFLIRGAYLLVLSFILIWFGVHQRGGASARTDLALVEDGDSFADFVGRALTFVAAHTGANRVILAWSEKEEPWLMISKLVAGTVEHQRLAPGHYGPIVDEISAKEPFLFDLSTGHVLRGNHRRQPRIDIAREPLDPQFVAEHALKGGLYFPIDATEHEGHLFALEIDGPSADLLNLAAPLSGKIARGFDRLAASRTSLEAAEERARVALARDLHDHVVQLLAGTAFRLEAIRAGAAHDQPVDVPINELQEELSRGQRDLRAFITKLRTPRAEGARAGRCEDLSALCGELSRQWGIECRLTSCADRPMAGAIFHEVQQLVRESVANAVKHGRAKRVDVTFSGEDDGVRLEIEDDGMGLSEILVSESLTERVAAFGGDLQMRPAPVGCKVQISLPLEIVG